MRRGPQSRLRPPLTEAAQKRLHDAWKDPELSLDDVVRRFELTSFEVIALRAEIGAKARPVAFTPGAMRVRRSKARRRAAR